MASRRQLLSQKPWMGQQRLIGLTERGWTGQGRWRGEEMGYVHSVDMVQAEGVGVGGSGGAGEGD